MRLIKPEAVGTHHIRIFLFAFLLSSFSIVNAQPFLGVTWKGYNTFYQTFPMGGMVQSPYFTTAVHDYKGLQTHNDGRCIWLNPNSATVLDVNTAPYLSYTVVTKTAITFDRFVLNGYAPLHPSKTQLRWSVDNFSTSLGKFTGSSNYTLTSVSLASKGSIPAGSIELRIYYYAATGYRPAYVYNTASPTVYPSFDGTPVSYFVQNASVSLWYSAPLGVLPVTLQDFGVKGINNAIQLSWETSTENNTAFFSIERSNNASSFTEIARIAADGQHGKKYSLNDNSPLAGTCYYRLKIIDKDGSFKYSEVKNIEYSLPASTTKIYPVPASDYVNVENPNKDFLQTYIYVSDAAGNLILKTKVSSSVQKFNISSLVPGIYFIKLFDGKDYRIIKK